MAKYLILLAASALFFGCSGASSPSQESNAQVAENAIFDFSADSAYQYVVRQMEFGPRVPGTDAQRACADWMSNELKRHGAAVKRCESTVTAYDGTRLPCINIVGSYNPSAERRILLMAHWDSRHVADNDPDPSKRKQPVPAANDGASGVAVLLEIARQLGQKQPSVGIDIFLTDAEDYGAPDDWEGDRNEKFWALGTQEWCNAPHVEGYKADFGILLDMVGAADATFYREYYSDRYASDVVNLVWRTAAKLGYDKLFIDRSGAGITDDHTFVNRMRNIPTIDIIDTRMTGGGTFYPHWHTTDDTLDKISRETLGKVGNVLMNVIY